MSKMNLSLLSIRVYSKKKKNGICSPANKFFPGRLNPFQNGLGVQESK